MLINGLVYAKGTTETLHSQDVFQIPCDEPGPHHRHVWHFLLPQISTDKDRKTMAQQVGAGGKRRGRGVDRDRD